MTVLSAKPLASITVSVNLSMLSSAGAVNEHAGLLASASDTAGSPPLYSHR